MQCENCGAPMRKPNGADYYICDYCFSVKYPENSKISFIKTLEVTSDYACPVCGSLLTEGLLYEKKVFFCKQCGGILIKMSDFASVVETMRAFQTKKTVNTHKITEEELNRVIRCPICGSKTDTHPYYGPGHVVIDTCPECFVVWLDSEELTKIVVSI